LPDICVINIKHHHLAAGPCPAHNPSLVRTQKAASHSSTVMRNDWNWNTMWKDIQTFWKKNIHGVELVFDLILLGLRILSISYWLRTILPTPESPNHKLRDNVIDIYCIFQLAVLLILLVYSFGVFWNSIIGGYILFEIYLNLFNIVFIGKNAPPSSVERSILLLILNVIDVVLAFSVFYRDRLDLSRFDAVFQAVLVLGTVGYPYSCSGNHASIVILQIFLDFVLIVLFVSSFIGRIGLFEKDKK
jgi:hypothetical protein